jgi:TetR/AcrR family transcriptional regulator, regulator of cefoperazone and chloramphenicol sensitivity
MSKAMETDQTPRAYHSPKRAEQAQQTRAAIAAAARTEFLAHGWAGTRVRDVARAAGVGEATVYAVYGSKAGLARALVDAAEIAAGAQSTVAEVLAAGPEDPRAQLAAMIATDRRLFEQNGDLITLLHDAGRSDPDLRAAYDEGRGRAGHLQRAVFDSWPAAWFRPGADAALAADTYAALATIGVYQVLTGERGWTPDQVEAWWRESLSRLLLPG